MFIKECFGNMLYENWKLKLNEYINLNLWICKNIFFEVVNIEFW